MNSPFYPWLKRLEGKEASIQTTFNNDETTYNGSLILADKEVFVMKERDKSSLGTIDDIDYIEVDKEFIRIRPSNSKGPDKFWKWLKGLEKKEARIVCETHTTSGKIIKVDKDLFFVEDYKSVCISKISKVRSITAKSENFNIKSIVKFEEVE